MPRRVLLLSITLTLGPLAHAEQLLLPDGREVLLNEDGTWTFSSSDRFVDTADGKRVRLMDDGRWEYVGNAPLVTERQQRTTTFDLQLADVIIQRTEKKIQKNTRVRTRTVFTLSLRQADEAETALDLAQLDTAQVSVTDDNGKSYEVIGVQADNSTVKPGASSTVTVIADKSPFIFDDVKSMSVTISETALDTAEPVTLSRSMDDIDEIKVERFD